MVQPTELYLGSHVHKVVENERGGLQGSPATTSQRVWEAHAICMLLPLLLWRTGTGGWGQQTCVYQLNVVQPRQQVGEHYLPTIRMSGRKPLADLWARVMKKKEKRSVVSWCRLPLPHYLISATALKQTNIQTHYLKREGEWALGTCRKAG